MMEDPEITVLDVKDISARLKIEFQADNIQKILIMQKKSKGNWQNILEKKIEDPKISEIIQDVNNLDPASKYKFQAVLTAKNGKIIQLDEVRIVTNESSDVILSEDSVNLVKSICEDGRKIRIGFVGAKDCGKALIIDSIATIFDKDYKRHIIHERSSKHRSATSDVLLPTTNITLVEYHGSFDQSNVSLNNMHSFIHGLIPEDTVLNDTSHSNISVCFRNNEKRRLDAIVIIVAATDSEKNVDHIRQVLLLANKAGVKSVVFVTKPDLLAERTAATPIITAMVEHNIPKEFIYHIAALNIDDNTITDQQAKPLLSALKHLTQKPVEKERVLRLLIRQKDGEIFKQCWIEEKKCYIKLLESICKTFVLAHPPLKIYELRNGHKIAIDSDTDTEELKDKALIEFDINGNYK